MSKALVIIRQDGTALKWSGKYHNHLAVVGSDHGRILRFLPVYIVRNYTDKLFYVVTPTCQRVDDVKYVSKRHALESLSDMGICDADGHVVVASGIEVEQAYAEDLHEAYKAAFGELPANGEKEDRTEAKAIVDLHQ